MHMSKMQLILCVSTVSKENNKWNDNVVPLQNLSSTLQGVPIPVAIAPSETGKSTAIKKALTLLAPRNAQDFSTNVLINAVIANLT